VRARSKRLFGPVLLTVAPQLVYTVPADRVALLKWIRLVTDPDTAHFFDLCMDVHDFAHALYWQASLPKRDILVDNEETVLHAGETLIAATSVDDVAVLWGSGAELLP